MNKRWNILLIMALVITVVSGTASMISASDGLEESEHTEEQVTEDVIPEAEELVTDEQEVKQEEIEKPVENTEANTKIPVKEKMTSRAEVVPPKHTVSRNKQTARIGEQLSFDVDDLSFKAPDGDTMSDYRLNFYSERYIESLELESIELPYMYGVDVDGNTVENVTVYFFAFTDWGQDYMNEPINIPYGSQDFSNTFHRQEMLDVLEENNFGKFPPMMWLRFEGIDANGNVVELNELHVEGAVTFKYNVVDESPYGDGNYAGYLGSVLEYRYRSDFDAGRDTTKNTNYSYIFFESSDVTITSDKVKDLVPGDIIELDINVENTADHLGNRLSLYLKMNGLEPIFDVGDARWNWEQNGDVWSSKLMDDTGTILLFNQNESKSFKHKFKVTEGYTGETIKIDPGLSVYGLSNEVEYNSPITLYMKAPIQKYTATFESNGGSRVPVQVVNKDKLFTIPTAPTKEGFIFAGWYVDKTVAKEYDFNAQATQDIILYAKWDKVLENPNIKPDTSSKVDSVATGDRSQSQLWMGIALASSILAGIIFIRKRMTR